MDDVCFSCGIYGDDVWEIRFVRGGPRSLWVCDNTLADCTSDRAKKLNELIPGMQIYLCGTRNLDQDAQLTYIDKIKYRNVDPLPKFRDLARRTRFQFEWSAQNKKHTVRGDQLPKVGEKLWNEEGTEFYTVQ